jgi:hypothetical protein
MSSVFGLKDIENRIEEYAISYANTQLEILCRHYNLDVNEAMETMKNISNAETNVKPIAETNVKTNVNQIAETTVETNVKPIAETNVETNVKPIAETNVKPIAETNVETTVKQIAETNVETIVEQKTKEPKKKEPKTKEPKKAKVEEKLEMEIELPFSGEIDAKRCHGIRTAGKLYTQCLTYTKNGVRYCKKCQKDSEKNESGKPINGDIEERKIAGLYEFKDKDGKNPWPYYKLMRKHGWSREYVEEIAAKYGMTISEEHFNEKEMEKPVHQKGKPKGRPKKKEKQFEAVEEENEAPISVELKGDSEAILEPELELEENYETDEEEKDEVAKVEEDGKLYLRSKQSGLIYSADNMINPTVVGIWDRVRERIDFNYKECSDDDDDYDDDDDDV